MTAGPSAADMLEEHREYLGDPVRLEAFWSAIQAAVSPGAVVLDFASGTGVLGLMALKAGASRVYAIEATGIIEVARHVAAANGVADRITFIRAVSRRVSLPEPVDVIVCDQIGHFGFEAGLLDDGRDARERILRPGGRFVPARVDLFIAPVEDESAHAQMACWSARPQGFDFSPVRTWAANTGYPTRTAAASLLGPAERIGSLDMMSAGPDPLTSRTRHRVQRPGALHGLAGWFSATLSPGVELSNGPTARARMRRRNTFLPIDPPVSVVAGDIVQVDLHIIPTEAIMSWKIAVEREGHIIARSRHSSLQGMLVSRSELQRTDPRFVPTLTRRGQARQAVFELCDGRRSLADIEREVHGQYPDLFESAAAAAVFVGEVVSAYSAG